MRILLIVGATLALAACGGGGDTQANDGNMAAENTMMDQNMALDPMMNGTGNLAMDPAMNGAAGNGMNPATQNMIQQDMNTNEPDTNLANGM